MSEQIASLPDLIRETVSDPQSAARRIISLDLPVSALWEALALVVVLSVIAAQITTMLMAPGGVATGSDSVMPRLFESPILLGFVQGSILVIMVFAIHWIGRSFGGHGAFEDAIAVVAWLQFLLVCLQVLQGVLGLMSPALSGLIGIVALAGFFWLLTQFVMVLHGFQNAALVFVGIMVSMLGMTFGLSVILTLMGITLTGEVPDV